MPFLMSGSTMRCIIIEDKSLGITMRKSVGGLRANFSLPYISTIRRETITIYIPITMRAPKNTLAVSSSVK